MEEVIIDTGGHLFCSMMVLRKPSDVGYTPSTSRTCGPNLDSLDFCFSSPAAMQVVLKKMDNISLLAVEAKIKGYASSIGSHSSSDREEDSVIEGTA